MHYRSLVAQTTLARYAKNLAYESTANQTDAWLSPNKDKGSPTGLPGTLANESLCSGQRLVCWLAVTQAAALSPEAPLLFPDAGTNVCFGTAFGADEDPLQGAVVVAEVAMVSQRLAGVPMEPNGCLMAPGEPTGGITCWISHQAPHSVQPAFCAVLGLEPEAVRVVTPWVGGGFGPKAAIYVERSPGH